MDPTSMASLLDMFFVFFFFLAWPSNLWKSWRSRTAKGKSLLFNVFALCAYACGISRHIVIFFTDLPAFRWYAVLFYVINFLVVILDSLLYFRNRRLDRAAEQGREAAA